MGKRVVDIDQLSQQERLDLIEELWESLSDATRDAMPLTTEQELELDSRIASLDTRGPTGLTPEQVREQVRRRSS